MTTRPIWLNASDDEQYRTTHRLKPDLDSFILYIYVCLCDWKGSSLHYHYLVTQFPFQS
jgi:hypothetical protein